MLAGMLDRTEQRIIGVLIEKERTVPDSYPLSENALVDGCNQKSNRDPVMDLQAFEVAGALMALQERGYVAKVEGGGRVARYRHRLAERLVLQPAELAVLTELLLRGPQAPGALKPRVARMGYEATPEQIEAVLRQLQSRSDALVEPLPRQPRERDARWRHRLGPASSSPAVAAAQGDAPPPRRTPEEPPRRTPEVANTAPDDLAARVEALEHAVADLRARFARLAQP